MRYLVSAEVAMTETELPLAWIEPELTSDVHTLYVQLADGRVLERGIGNVVWKRLGPATIRAEIRRRITDMVAEAAALDATPYIAPILE